MNDNNYGILTFEVREDDGIISILLPEPVELDLVLGTDKWMIRASDNGMEAQSTDQVQFLPGCLASSKSLDW